MTLEDKVHGFRLHALRRAEELGNVSAACRQLERAIVATAWPTWGPKRVSLQLERQGIHVPPSTVWRALRRMGLGRREARLLAVEGHAARTAAKVIPARNAQEAARFLLSSPHAPAPWAIAPASARIIRTT
ncbi:MAG: hypothetical protein NUV94_03800, partial [Candidatus Acetothermia bacterium]|nr:hypothetical protein [Candidatus Acetothermia bacterium]